MKKFTFKKYPLLICAIVSAVIIVASLFVIGFAGLKFDSTIVGGSQVEVVIEDNANTMEISNNARVICKQVGLSLYSTKVEDKYVAGNDNGEYTKRVLILTLEQKNISAEKQTEFREKFAEKLGYDISKISEFEEVTSMIFAKNIWLVFLAVGIVVLCLFIFACIRYNIFAGIVYLIAILHNIILYFAFTSLVRLPVGLTSIATLLILTFIVILILTSIFENYRKFAILHVDDKQTISEKLISAEKTASIPYIFVAVMVIFIGLILLLSPSFMVRIAACAILVILLISAYTVLLVAPAVYAYLLGISKNKINAKLSRNANVNKLIKKKVAKKLANK